MDFLELLGYTATALLMLSFTAKGLNRIRAINSIATVCFFIYSGVLGLYPVAIGNAVLFVLQILPVLGMPAFNEKSLKFAKILFLIVETGFIVLCVFGIIPVVETIGYSAMLLMFYGFMQPDEMKMRKFCLPSSILYLAYAAFTGNVVMCVSNIFLSIVHIAKLTHSSFSRSRSALAVREPSRPVTTGVSYRR